MTTDELRAIAEQAVAHDHLDLSNREIAKLIGVTHPTVAKLARRWRRQAAEAAGEAPEWRVAEAIGGAR